VYLTKTDPEENIASVNRGSKLINGTVKGINCLSENINSCVNHTFHKIDGTEFLLVKMDKVYIINNMKLWLYDDDVRYVKYFLNFHLIL